MKSKSKEKSKNYTPNHGIRVDDRDYKTIAKFLKKANRSWNWLFKVLANQIKQRQSINVDLLLLEARKKESSRAVHVWKEDKGYKSVRESFPVLNKEREVDEWI